MAIYQNYKKVFVWAFGIFMLAGFLYIGYSATKIQTNLNPGWTNFRDPESNIVFQFPEKLPTKYIHALDWPPKLAVFNNTFTCTQAGSEIAPAGKTVIRDINAHRYCVTTEKQGAAGSIYTQYAYASQKNNKVIIATFTMRSVQCANYEDPQKTECEQERTTFEIDTIIDRIFDTMQFQPSIAGEKIK